MVKVLLKKVIDKSLHLFGYKLCKAEASSLDAFTVQSKLIQVKQPVIFDVGAHIGGIAQEYKKLFPEAWIHCFEPFPQSFQVILDRLGTDDRIFCCQAAISDKIGKAKFNANINPVTNSLLSTDKRGDGYWGKGLLNTTSQIEVNTITIDQYCIEKGISHLDILKIDVQGAEYSVLLGASNMLKNQKITLIYFEIIFCPTYIGQRKINEYLSLLDSFGYEFIDFYNVVRRNNRIIQADFMFLSSSSKTLLQST